MTKGLQRSLLRGDQDALASIVKGVGHDLVKVTIPVAVSIDSVTTGAAIGFGSISLDDLPEGNVIIHGIVADLTFSGPGASDDLSDTWDGDWAIGSTPVSDATISVGDEDIITETAMGAATAEVSPLQHVAEIPAGILNNTAADLELNLNLLVDAADQVDDKTVVIDVAGTVVYTSSILGDD